MSEAILIAIIGGLITLGGGVITLWTVKVQTRSQETIAKLTVRVTTAEKAHTELNAKVQSDAEIYAEQRKADQAERERSAELVQRWQDNYSAAQKLVGEVSTKYNLLAHDFEGMKFSLDEVTKLSERQKEQISAGQKQQDRNIAAIQTAGETIASLKAARDSDHRDFEDTISRANDESERKQRTLQGQIDKLTDDLKSANDKIDELTRQLEETKENTASQMSKLREDLASMRSERDQAIKERDEFKRQLDEMRKPDPVAAALQSSAEMGPPL